MSVRYLGFDHTATLFHIRDSPVDPVDRPIYLTNTFTFAIRIHNVSLPAEAKTMFSVSVTRCAASFIFNVCVESVFKVLVYKCGWFFCIRLYINATCG